jgi:hypothetical protein
VGLLRRKGVKFASVEDAVAYFRPLGFFASWQGDDRALAEDLMRRYREEWDRELRVKDGDFDEELLELDEDRVLLLDMEGDWLPGNDGYVELLAGLARISRGRFAPQDAKEEWSGDEHVRITFTHRGEPVTLEPKVDEDWLDPGFIADLEKALGPAEDGAELRVSGNGHGQAIYLVDLRPDEVAKLRADRGLDFA